MRMGPILAGALLASVVFCGQHACAFTVDEKSNTNADGSPRFTDPDEELGPSLLFGGQGQSEHADYGSNFGPGDTGPASNQTGNGFNLWTNHWPAWLFSTPSSRK